MGVVRKDSKKVKECEKKGHGRVVKIGGGDDRYMCLSCGVVVPGKKIKVERSD